MTNTKSSRTQAREDAWKLAHDVGKYASRTARNLPSGEISDGISRLLYEDLFKTDGKESALTLFEELAKTIEEVVKDNKLEQCRQLLIEIEGLREQIGEFSDTAIRRAATMVIEVDSLLRELVKELDGANS